MPLTKALTKEITDTISTALGNFKQIEKLERELIVAKLIQIDEKVEAKLTMIEGKVDKINGNIIRHSDKITALEKGLPHTKESCPHNNDIEMLKENYQEEKGVKKWKTVALTFLVGAIGVVAGIVATLEFILKYKP